MPHILFLDACPRSESRTRRLANALIKKLDGYVTTLRLSELDLRPLDEKALALRGELISLGKFSDPSFSLARQFSEAENIVIAAPFWDLSFPALVKLYFEQICITGITFRYTPEGIPEGLCRASNLYYVTTSGGPCIPDFGFGYIRALSQQFFGIPSVSCVSAENLDIEGTDPEAILADIISKL